jgi:nucleoside-diphosphate kinase
MAIERSLILLKPDCLNGHHAGEVIGRFEKAGFEIRAAKLIALTDDLLKEHYAHIAARPFFPEIVEFMSARPVLALVLEGENAVTAIRDLLGPTDSTVAPAGTIRGDMGTTSMENICHASDSTENAAIEVERFFNPGEVH